jgi:hypothetical protein
MTACAPGVDARAFEASGRLATKEEAKAAVEQAYARFLTANPKARDHWQKHCAELEARMAARNSGGTENNVPGMLSSRIIKALCQVLHEHAQWRDSGMALIEAFDHIDLEAIHAASALEAAEDKLSRVTVIAERIRGELETLFGTRLRTAAE